MFYRIELDSYHVEEVEVEVVMIDLEVVVQVELVVVDNENVDYNYCSYDDDFDIEMRMDVDTMRTEMMTTIDYEVALVDDSMMMKRSELALSVLVS